MADLHGHDSFARRRWGIMGMVAMGHVVCLLAGCAGPGRHELQKNPMLIHDESQAVYQAASDQLVRRGFDLELVSPVAGVIRTAPHISSSLYEFWSHDTQGSRSSLEATLHTIRRTVQLSIVPVGSGDQQITCQVTVQRYGLDAARYGGSPNPQSVFSAMSSGMPSIAGRDYDHRGDYWVALGRDTALENAILNDIALAIE